MPCPIPLYTADVCRKLDLRAGLAAYPTEEESLRASLCPAPGDYRDFRVFRGYVEQSTWRSDPKIITASCPVCGGNLQPDDIWLKKGNSGWYTLSVCPACAGTGNEAGKGVFQRYKLARRDGLHWSFARCVQIPDEAGLTRWERMRASRSSGCRPGLRRPPLKPTEKHKDPRPVQERPPQSRSIDDMTKKLVFCSRACHRNRIY